MSKFVSSLVVKTKKKIDNRNSDICRKAKREIRHI